MENHNVVYLFFMLKYVEVVMMRKGQKKRVWTPEQKSEIVHKHLDDHISVRTLEREYTADRSMICRWVKEYIAEGETAFIPKVVPAIRLPHCMSEIIFPNWSVYR